MIWNIFLTVMEFLIMNAVSQMRSMRSLRSLHDSRLIEKLGNESVEEIYKIGGGYNTVTDSRYMIVYVTYLISIPEEPPCFDLEFNEPVSLSPPIDHCSS